MDGRAFKFLFAALGIFGVANFYLDKRRMVKTYPCLRIYSVALLIAYSVFFSFDLERSASVWNGEVIRGLPRYDRAIFLLTSLASFAATIYNQTKLVEWIRNVRHLVLGPRKNILKKLSVVYGITACTIFVSLIIIAATLYIHDGDTSYGIWALTALHGTSMVTLQFFIMGVTLLVFLFEDVNDELTEILRSPLNWRNPHVTNLFVLECGRYNDKKVEYSINVNKIRYISAKHYLYCSLSVELNECFSLQLLLFTGLCFVKLTFGVFGLAVTPRELMPPNTGYAWPIVWVLFYALQLLGFTVPCEKLISEASRSCNLVRKLNNSDTRKDIKHALEIFSIQIHQVKINMTAMGFFPLNNTLLYEMVGNITSALIVLIQFHKYSSSVVEVTTINTYNSTWTEI